LILVVGVAGLILTQFSVRFLTGDADIWRHPVGDLAEHTIGARYFLADRWRFPLLFVPALGTPGGTNIGLTDSIPAVAILAKLLRGVIGVGYSYFPIWLAFCYVAQGPAAALALSTAGVRGIAPLVIGGLIFVFMPILLMRYSHAALCGQFLILLALALHFQAARVRRPAVAAIGFVPLLLFALLVHVYLFAMVFAVFAAALLQGLWNERLTIRAALLLLAVTLLGATIAMGACGYLGLGPIPIKPYGDWPLDLAAPFAPGPSLVFGRRDLAPAIGFESLAWSGAGAAALILCAFVLNRRKLAGLLREHFPLFVICIVLILFAATYNFRIDGHLVLGLSSGVLRKAVLDPGDGGTLAALRRLLGVHDAFRIGAYLILLVSIAGGFIAVAVRLRRTRFVSFLIAAIIVIAVGAALRPGAAALVISSFQASARFVWVPLYVVVLASIAGVSARLGEARAALLLLAALLLQIYDTTPLWRTLEALPAIKAPQTPGAEAMMARAQAVMIVPTYLCAHGQPIEPDQKARLIDRIIDLQVIASQTALPINSVRSSRMSAADPNLLRETCRLQRDAAMASAAHSGVLTVLLAGAPAEADAARAIATGRICPSLSGDLFCLAP
jgi:hypothetical protein